MIKIKKNKRDGCLLKFQNAPCCFFKLAEKTNHIYMNELLLKTWDNVALAEDPAITWPHKTFRGKKIEIFTARITITGALEKQVKWNL